MNPEEMTDEELIKLARDGYVLTRDVLDELIKRMQNYSAIIQAMKKAIP